MQMGGNSVAASGSSHPAGAAGGAKRPAPVGGAANGMPRYLCTGAADSDGAETAVATPLTTPEEIVTVGLVPLMTGVARQVAAARRVAAHIWQVGFIFHDGLAWCTRLGWVVTGK